MTESVDVGYRDLLGAALGSEVPVAPVASRVEGEFERATTFPSARAALVQAFRAAGLTQSDTVLVPAYTCHALVEAVREVATPEFVDVTLPGGNMDLDRLAAAAPDASAVVPVHLYGNPMDVARVRDVAEDHDLVVVEDAAQALGAAVSDQPIGRHADYCVFSLRFSKESTVFRGGILLGDQRTSGGSAPSRTALLKLGTTKVADDTLARIPGQIYEPLRRRVLDPFFQSSAESIHSTDRVAFTPAQFRLLERQLRELPARVAVRRRHARRYGESLAGPIETPDGIEGHTYYRYPVFVPAEARDELRRDLTRAGIGVSSMYSYTVAPEGYPGAESAASRVLNLPVHAGLESTTVDRISNVFNRLVERHC